jgi:hypothetical protein
MLNYTKHEPLQCAIFTAYHHRLQTAFAFKSKFHRILKMCVQKDVFSFGALYTSLRLLRLSDAKAPT